MTSAASAQLTSRLSKAMADSAPVRAILESPPIKSLLAQPRVRVFLDHPAGPKTIHFWAPAFKWSLVIAGLADINRPVEKVSTAQSTALLATGLIWARYSTQITPVNYSLLSVNVFVALTGGYQIARKLRHSLQNPKNAAA